MTVETLRARVSQRLLDVAWGQWAQMGVSTAPLARSSLAAADPEALLLFTLVVGRDDPRLFDEVLDWLLAHEAWVSVHRLRGLCVGEADRALVDAALDWAAAWGPRHKSAVREMGAAEFPGLESLFQGAAGTAVSEMLDVSFAKRGFSRPPLVPSRKSTQADIGAPINFALRLRRLFGVGVRAEVIRALLTIRAPRLPGQVIAASAGFSARNVRDGLASVVEAKVIDMVLVSDDRFYLPNLDRWAPLFGFDEVDEFPRHVDWIQVFRAMAKLLRWLDIAVQQDWSDYFLASQARTLMDELQPDLRYAGMRADGPQVLGAAYWAEFERQVVGVLDQLPRGHA